LPCPCPCPEQEDTQQSSKALILCREDRTRHSASSLPCVNWYSTQQSFHIRGGQWAAVHDENEHGIFKFLPCVLLACCMTKAHAPSNLFKSSSYFSLPCMLKLYTANTFAYLPCLCRKYTPFCRVLKHGKVFAVFPNAFVVFLLHTAKCCFPVVTTLLT
jgi:hypothetical protein